MGWLRYIGQVFKLALSPSFGRADTISCFASAILYGIGKLGKVETIMNIDWWWLPLIVLGAIFAIRLLLAPYWLHKDTIAAKVKAENDLQKADWDNERRHRIEIISNQDYPSKLPQVLYSMKNRLTELVDIVAQRKVTGTQLEEAIRTLTPEDLGRLHQKSNTYQDERLFLFVFQTAMDANGIGLAKVKAKDSEWKRLSSELEDTQKDIPDQDLNDYIRDHRMALDGVYTWKLYERYLEKTHTQPKREIAKAMQADFFDDALLIHTNTRVERRLQELLKGDEPRWEAR